MNYSINNRKHLCSWCHVACQSRLWRNFATNSQQYWGRRKKGAYFFETWKIVDAQEVDWDMYNLPRLQPNRSSSLGGKNTTIAIAQLPIRGRSRRYILQQGWAAAVPHSVHNSCHVRNKFVIEKSGCIKTRRRPTRILFRDLVFRNCPTHRKILECKH